MKSIINRHFTDTATLAETCRIPIWSNFLVTHTHLSKFYTKKYMMQTSFIEMDMNPNAAVFVV